MLRSIGIAIIFNLLLVPALRGQQENLILNGSLEDYNVCPFEADILKAKHWSAGEANGFSSTNYFHACAGRVPSNGSSWVEHAAHGMAYLGMGNGSTLDSTISSAREFASGTLKNCLVANKRYRLSFRVNPPALTGNRYIGYDCFEVLFHSQAFPLEGPGLGVTRRFNEMASQTHAMPLNAPIIQRGKWHLLELEFTATGNECYFTIGCFKWLRPENIDTLIGPGSNGIVFQGVYYLYDDFVLTEIPDDTTPPAPEPVVPNVFTPNADGHNDYWVIKHLPPATSVAIYNRWGQRVYFSENYTNDWGGEGLPSGTYIAELVFRDLPHKRQAVYLKR